MSYIEDGKQAGAKVIVGGNKFGNEGYFIEPTIFTNTKGDMRIVREEIFGPVGVLIKFKDEEGVFVSCFFFSDTKPAEFWGFFLTLRRYNQDCQRHLVRSGSSCLLIGYQSCLDGRP